MKLIKLVFYLLTVLISQGIMAQDRAVAITDEAREQHIQRALQLRKEEKYFSAVEQLDSILYHNPVDGPILLFKGDLLLQSNRFAEAAADYKKILSLNYEHSTTQINLSYALFMNHKPALALQYAKAAWEESKINTSAIVNYFNAMLWNIKTKEAAGFLEEQSGLLTKAQHLVLKARLYTTSGDYKNGLNYYDSLVNLFPDKYYVQEYAEVLLGKKEMKQSEAIMKNSERLFSVNEYKAFNQKIKAAQLQNAGTEFVYFKDVAKNIRLESSAWWQQRDGKIYRFRLSAGLCTIFSAIKEKTTSQFAHLGINERWNKSWTGETDLHFQLIQPPAGKKFIGITGRQTLQYQPNDRRMVGLVYHADILNYTASLLQKNIRSNNLGYVMHIMLSGKTGFYSQGSTGLLSDKNHRQMLFGSLYHLFRTEPMLKAGLNFSALHYADSSIKNYFSPNRYLSTEVFTDYSTALPPLSQFYLQLQAAAGMQQIEKQKWEPAYRFQTELGLRLNRFETAIKYQTSNQSSSTGTGYKFNWFTFRLIWKW